MDSDYSGGVPRYFQMRVMATPGSCALRSRAGRMTYAGLDASSDCLAHRLVASDFAKGDLAGVLLGRSAAAIISFLGVLKAGGAFVPLDPASPPGVLLGVLRRHNIRYILSDGETLCRFPEVAQAATVIVLGALEAEGTASPASPRVTISGSDPACIVFTSGSTGEPKGAVIPHRAIVRLVKKPGYMEFSQDQIFLQASPMTFDASLFEIWGALLNGAELVIPDPGLLTLETIGASIEEQGVTTLFLTSGLFNLMIDQRPGALRKLRYLLSGGDVMSPPHVAKAVRLLKQGQFISVYGPTENTTFTTTFAAPQDFAWHTAVPIGRPVAGTVLRILGENRQPVPEGLPGELYVGGTGLALGYLDAPHLTQQKFIEDPSDPGQRLYRTGDLVRRDKHGVLHFLGRIDNQIKINGNRVEPEHVEAVLRRHLPVTDIAAVACMTGSGAKHLAAFVVPRRGAPLSQSALREIASRCLAPHLVPSRFETIDAFPLTATGKIDRLALARLAAAAREKKALSPVASASVAESMLIEVWRKHLQLETVDIDQNFFDLGGTSLQLVGIHAELEQLFPGELSIQDLFDLPTIKLVSARLAGAKKADAIAQAGDRAALQRRARSQRSRLSSALHADSASGT